jgi:putative transposase
MIVRKAFKYRHYPTPHQAERLAWVLRRCQELYNMVRNPCLAKSIADAGWNQFLTILTRKAEETGVVVVVVNPAGTSQVCSRCGRTVPKTLSNRWHTCPYEDCGLSLQRDHNSARTILHRAGLARAGV